MEPWVDAASWQDFRIQIRLAISRSDGNYYKSRRDIYRGLEKSWSNKYAKREEVNKGFPEIFCRRSAARSIWFEGVTRLGCKAEQHDHPSTWLGVGRVVSRLSANETSQALSKNWTRKGVQDVKYKIQGNAPCFEMLVRPLTHTHPKALIYKYGYMSHLWLFSHDKSCGKWTQITHWVCSSVVSHDDSYQDYLCLITNFSCLYVLL